MAIPIAALVAVLVAVGVALATSGSSPSHRQAAPPTSAAVTHAPTATTAATRPASRPAAVHRRRRRPPAHPASVTSIHVVSIRVTDPHRTMLTPHGRVRRAFTVLIRIPVGPRGPFALIVFGHGYAVTPAPYAPLLDAWARAGYVVAAPVFPLENAAAPGGPDERDLPNQPRDMSLVIDVMLARFGGLVRHHRIAVSGQSDGGDTALATAFDPRVRDPRVSAAVILSGAFDPFTSPFTMPAAHVPLLAVQGTADTINPPSMTDQFYDPATAPKFLLKLLGQGHLPPYTQPGVTLNTVARGSTAFLNCYLQGSCARWQHFRAKGSTGTPSVLSGI